MTLIVEDGSIVPNANSYAALSTVKTYAALRGVVLSNDDAVLEPMVIKAMDYIESNRANFQGNKVSELQELQFPRSMVYVDGVLIPETTIPKCLIYALCQAVMEVANDVDLLPTTTEPAIRKEVVGPIETEYAVSLGSGGFSPELRKIDSLLKPVLNTSSGFGLSTLRI